MVNQMNNTIPNSEAYLEQLDKIIESTSIQHNHYSWDHITKWMFKRNSLRKVARASWDNTINQEYIVWSIEGGLVKHYTTVAIDYYKKVEHTFKPTKEDLEATDWYII